VKKTKVKRVPGNPNATDDFIVETDQHDVFTGFLVEPLVEKVKLSELEAQREIQQEALEELEELIEDIKELLEE